MHRVIASRPRWKLPSDTRTFRGLQVALPHCGVLAANPTAKRWPDCCGFVVLPESQSQWLILRHGCIDVVPAAIGLKATDQSWHYEQWLHLKFAERKRRRDISPSDSKSRQTVVLYNKK